MLNRRTFLMTAASFAGASAAGAQQAAWPTRPITLVVPFGAGGGVDVVARLLGQRLAEKLGVGVTIENVSGAGGAIGTQKVARSAPDGYTLLMGVESTMVINKILQPAVVKYEAADFDPVALIGETPIAIMVRKDFPANTLDEMLDLLRKAEPGKYSFATSGVGSSLHLAGEMINLDGRVHMTHLPYRSGSQIATDVTGGHIDIAVITLVTALPLARAGQAKILALTKKEKTPLAPDLPVLGGHPQLGNIDVFAWYGLFAPARTDAAVIARLSQETRDAVADPAINARLADLTVVTRTGGSPGAFKAFVAAEARKYEAVVKAANVKIE